MKEDEFPVCSGLARDDGRFRICYPTHIERFYSYDPMRIITDEMCNCVFVSSLLRDGNPDYPKVNFRNVYDQLSKALKGRAELCILEDTKDVWVRDYMPVQLHLMRGWDYIYRPDYLKKYQSQQTDWHELNFLAPFCMTNCSRAIVADGGNVVKCDEYVIMTDKVFAENKSLTHDKLVDSIGTDVVIIPRDPLDKYGHADGMIRYLGPRRVLFRAAQDKEDEVFLNTVKATFQQQKPDVRIEQFDFSMVDHQSKLNWCYINFLRVGRLILLPLLNSENMKTTDVAFEDYYALKQLSEFLPDCDIIGIPMRDVVQYGGGGLNCLTWTIRNLNSIFG